MRELIEFNNEIYQKMKSGEISEFCYICSHYKLPENIIIEFQNKFCKNCWIDICYIQELSEFLITELHHRMNWFWLCRKQKLSIEFIKNQMFWMNWNELYFNENIDNKELLRFSHFMDLRKIQSDNFKDKIKMIRKFHRKKEFLSLEQIESILLMKELTK